MATAKRSRAWCFTWNNPPDNADIIIAHLGQQYSIYQLEAGKEGTPHLQGLLYFASAKSFSAIKSLIPSTHLEPARNVTASIAYCSKPEGRLADPVEFGQRPGQGTRSDLQGLAKQLAANESLRTIAADDPANFIKFQRGLTAFANLFHQPRSWEMEVFVCTGPTGSGKTRFCFDKAPTSFWKEKGEWWDGYSGEEDVIIDEFAMDCPLTTLLRWLDRYPLRVPIKGGFVQFVAKRVFITSNIRLKDWYPNGLAEHKAALKRRISHNIVFPQLGSIVGPISATQG